MKMENLYFKEPRLKMTAVGRFLVRSVVYLTYAILIVGAALMIVGDVPMAKAAGILIAIFLLDRTQRAGKSARSLVKLPIGKVNVANYLSPAGYSVLEWAMDRSIAGGDFHLYAASRLAKRKEIQEGLLRMDIKAEDLIKQVTALLEGESNLVKVGREQLLRQVEDLARASFTEAVKTGSHQIETKDIFSALGLVGDENINRILKLFDVDAGDLENAMIFSRYQSVFSGLKRLPSSLVGLLGRPYKVRHRIMNRAWTSRPTPFLDNYALDLTDLARLEKVGFLIGHKVEYDRLVDVLSRPGRPNALLVGDPGVGKETLVAHLAFQIAKDRVPKPLFDKRLVRLNIGELVSGAVEGELQSRIKKILDEVVSAGNIILYIPDIHNLLKTSGQGRISGADMILPAIKSSAFSVVGATYPQEFKQHIEPSNDFVSAFENIRVQEISEGEAVQFLVYDSLLLEREYKTVISFAAIKEAVLLSKKYFRQKLLPASAEDLLKETLSDVVGNRKKIVTADDVIAVAEKKINVPIHKAGKAEAAQLLNLESIIHERLIDQEEAVKAVSRSLREYRSGLSRKGGPIASFLFVGPTGVGKTELSKILAKIQFGSSEMMARFDMSEYQEKSAVGRLLDNVTDRVREKPYSLLLLDEFEKAHADILNLFLQVFDDGRLTDSSGRTVDFQNTIIIATSNAHSDFIKSSLEKREAMSAIAEQLKKKLVDHFRPELLNRFSNIIVFKTLSPNDIEAIARINLEDLAATLRESQGIELKLKDGAVKEIARLGFDPVFGARPLRNVISEKLKGPLSEMILRGEIVRGGNVEVSVTNNQFNFQ